MSPGKIVGSLIGLLFALAGPFAILWLGDQWANRPANWPNYPLGICPAPALPFHWGTLPTCIHLGFGTSKLVKIQMEYDALQAQVAAGQQRAQAVTVRQAQLINQAGKDEAVTAAQIVAQHGRLAWEIIHAAPLIDTSTHLSVGYVRLHDAAVPGVDLSAVPDPSGRPDSAPAPIAPSVLLADDNDNYTECRADQDRLNRVLDLWDSLRSTWNTAPVLKTSVGGMAIGSPIGK